MFRGKLKWGDWLGLLSPNPCHQLQLQLQHQKATPPKPPVTRSKTRNQPTPTPVAAADLEADITAPVDAEYDTDELAELPTDSESEAVESEQGKETAQLEGQ